MNTTPVPPSNNSWTKSPFIISVGVGVALLISLGLMLKVGGPDFLRTSDVGGLAELASIQTQLQPLDACGIQYGPRRGRSQVFGSSDSVTVFSCAELSDVVGVDVPVERRTAGVTFEMTRRSNSDPWKVLVDKNKVQFPALKSSLEQLAPLIVEQYPPRLRRQREQEDAYLRQVKARKDEARAREVGAKDSYPE
ncbi:hypothetical protein ACLESO_06590 [Pyxidicoccus sp. 3LG]